MKTDFKDRLKEYLKNDPFFSGEQKVETDFEKFCYSHCKDIDDLLKENKELKKMLKRRIKYTDELEKDLFENASNYVIPKSKVREKIEELENYIQENSDEQGYWGREHQEEIYAKIEILQELLKERN